MVTAGTATIFNLEQFHDDLKQCFLARAKSILGERAKHGHVAVRQQTGRTLSSHPGSGFAIVGEPPLQSSWLCFQWPAHPLRNAANFGGRILVEHQNLFAECFHRNKSLTIMLTSPQDRSNLFGRCMILCGATSTCGRISQSDSDLQGWHTPSATTGDFPSDQ